ncbi:hypothetical protein [Nocardia brasiliensis]|uniref:hypothetical protein n=1 Tax=Nocardia brasiliensis TaxID=37326 RepID=UPI002453D505|nr:hypothetical protein [Nocardia brasiliensis]
MPPLFGREGESVGHAHQFAVVDRAGHGEAGTVHFIDQQLAEPGDVLRPFEVGRFGEHLRVQVEERRDMCCGSVGLVVHDHGLPEFVVRSPPGVGDAVSIHVEAE